MNVMSERQKPDIEESDLDVEEEDFGYSKEGNWQDIVDFGREIRRGLEEGEADSDTVDEWESWRPRTRDKEDEMREKTVEKAKMNEGENPAEKAEEAAEYLSESKKKTTEGDIEEAAENAAESAKSARDAVEGAGREVMRNVEEAVYKRITRTNPLYLDNEEFNASLEKITPLKERINRKIANGEDSEDTYSLSFQPQSESVKTILDDLFADEEREGEKNGE